MKHTRYNGAIKYAAARAARATGKIQCLLSVFIDQEHRAFAAKFRDKHPAA